MTLQEAVASIKNHDGQSEKAFQIIYEETRRTALAVIKRYCDISADYEDLLQETYIRVYRSIDTLKDDTKVGAWIRTIAGNTAIRHNMKKWPTMFSDMADEEGNVPDFEDESGTFNPEKIADRKAVSAAVTQILDSLPYDQRTALWMVYGQQVTIKEMAANLGISENTIKSRLYQGRQKLMARKDDFRKYGIELTAIPVSVLVAMAFQDTVYAAEAVGGATGAAAALHSFADWNKKAGVKEKAGKAAKHMKDAGEAAGKAASVASEAVKSSGIMGKIAAASIGTKAAVAGVGVAVVAAGGVVVNHANASYMEPIKEKIEGFNDRTYGMKTDFGVYYPDEVLKQIEDLLKNGDDYTTQDFYEQWENEESYQSVLFQQACNDYDAMFGDDWKITYKKKEANKLSKDKVKKLNSTYHEPYSVYPQSMLPAIYRGHSEEEKELENWFEDHVVKEAYELTLDMKIEGSKGKGETEAEAIVANYGGDWLLYAAGSPDDLVYYISFRKVDDSETEGEKDIEIAANAQPSVTDDANSQKTEEEKKAVQISSERIDVDETHYKINFSAAAITGEQIWEYVTEENISAELDSAGFLDITEDKVYIYDNGTVIALSAFTGEELWRNTEFTGGNAACITDEEGNLYICGYYGPDIMKIDPLGKTVYRIQTLDDQFYWPYQLDYIKHNNTIIISFDSHDSDSYENTLTVHAETGEIISNQLPQKTGEENLKDRSQMNQKLLSYARNLLEKDKHFSGNQTMFSVFDVDLNGIYEVWAHVPGADSSEERAYLIYIDGDGKGKYIELLPDYFEYNPNNGYFIASKIHMGTAVEVYAMSEGIPQEVETFMFNEKGTPEYDYNPVENDENHEKYLMYSEGMISAKSVLATTENLNRYLSGDGMETGKEMRE